ncbi:mitochondrial intermembrane space import and assembly protein 40 [Gaeumannomyces tritici R3-111a-1]|uniref:Mitochondrial intermembrane space import and assembly protein 40 n=1 Tax=Gaeumannomyces tritici (strain R3-111a-1) TaxID=644352 RepID=J3NQA1_GAET3|nr:mitochondrial intermembrane space import and assembly protein 40 [Gaeumannomyces tritici R3-111a-1]EJT78357.1 mitochondrial intermembrane space import and assembly protein 40 [Gaeumannomyces tritici R3-111a-1]
MYRATLRSTARAARSAAPTTTLTSTSRRYLSFKPSDKPRTWKGAAVRWGLAAGALYWYNTSPIFADEPLPQTIPAPPQFSDDDLPTVESVIAQKRKEAEAREKRAAASAPPTPPPSEKEKKETKPTKEDPATPMAAPEPGSPEALEEEASQQGAFNPETGEINWDCPCLGGMADGPCGEQFKAAFSCFVYSTEEPKGMDCIDKFQHMQDCFKKYPEIYGSELADEDGEEPTDAPASSEDAPAAAPKAAMEIQEKSENSAIAVASTPKEEDKEAQETPKNPPAPATTPEEENKTSVAPASTPKATSDATAANQK